MSTILLSVVEQFPNEVVGILFGYNEDNRISIDFILPLTHMSSSTDYVEFENERIDDISEFYTKNISPNHTYLGIYHSHNEANGEKGSPEQSSFDADRFHNRVKNNIDLIVACNLSDDEKKWILTNGGIKGSLGKYYFEILAYPQDDNMNIEFEFEWNN